MSEQDLFNDLKNQMIEDKNYDKPEVDVRKNSQYDKDKTKRVTIVEIPTNDIDEINAALNATMNLSLTEVTDEKRDQSTDSILKETKVVKGSGEIRNKNEISNQNLANHVQSEIADSFSKTIINQDVSNYLKNHLTVEKLNEVELLKNKQYGTDNANQMTFETPTDVIININEVLNDSFNKLSLTDNNSKETNYEKGSSSELTSEVYINVAETVAQEISDQDLANYFKNQMTVDKLNDVETKKGDGKKYQNNVDDDVDDFNVILNNHIDKNLLFTDEIEENHKQLTSGLLKDTKKYKIDVDDDADNFNAILNNHIDKNLLFTEDIEENHEQLTSGLLKDTKDQGEMEPDQVIQELDLGSKDMEQKYSDTLLDETLDEELNKMENQQFTELPNDQNIERTEGIKDINSEEEEIQDGKTSTDEEKQKEDKTKSNVKEEVIGEEPESKSKSQEFKTSKIDHVEKAPEGQKTHEPSSVLSESRMEQKNEISDNFAEKTSQKISNQDLKSQVTFTTPTDDVDDISAILNDHVDKLSYSEDRVENHKQLTESISKDILPKSRDHNDKSFENSYTIDHEDFKMSPASEDHKKALDIEPETSSRNQEEETPEVQKIEKPSSILRTSSMDQKKEDELLDQIIDEELENMKDTQQTDLVDEQQEGSNEKKEDMDTKKEQIGEEEQDSIVKHEGTADELHEKAKTISDDTYPAGYCMQDDVRYLKFIANLNKIACTCNRAENDFVLDDDGSDNHRRGCPSSLAARDVESVKVLFLTKHLPVCRRFLTTDERQVLKNILKTAPYYQMEFYNRHNPYEIKCDGEDLVKPHMVEPRTFPKRSDHNDGVLKNKKAILEDLKDILHLAPTKFDPNLDRFPAEEYKFGGKYAQSEKKRPVDINDYPYDRPLSSGKAVNTDIVDERLILNLFNDLEAWRCFTSICICDVIEPDDECEPLSNPAEYELKAALLATVAADEQKEMMTMIDKNLRYFDDLMKRRMRDKIDRERDHMQTLKEGKLKKEALFVEILSYRSKQSKKAKKEKELPALVNDMFRELIRNNKEIANEMESKLKREDLFMERDIRNQLKRRITRGELKLGFPNNEIFERYIQDTLKDQCYKANDLIRSELEYELDRSNEASLRLFQEVLNHMNQNSNNEYENISQHFKTLYPSPDKTPSLSEQFESDLNTTAMAWPQSSSLTLEQSARKKRNDQKFDHKLPIKRKSSEDVSEKALANVEKPVQPDATHKSNKKYVSSPEMKEVRDTQTQTSATNTQKSATKPKLETHDREINMTTEDLRNVHDTHTQTSTPTLNPENLGHEIDRMMEELWNESTDPTALVQELANEMRRYDLCEQSPQEKALSTKKSYKDFKEKMDSTLKPIPASKDRKQPTFPNRKTKTSNKVGGVPAKRADYEAETGNVVSFYDAGFRYSIIEMPMTDLKLRVFHDSFYGPKKSLAEISIISESRLIRTNIEMKD